MMMMMMVMMMMIDENDDDDNVWFQKISIPLPRKVFGLHPPTP